MANFFHRILYSLGFERGEQLQEQEAYQFDMDLGQHQIKVTKPNAFEETKQIAAYIKEGRPVIVNLEELPHAVSQLAGNIGSKGAQKDPKPPGHQGMIIPHRNFLLININTVCGYSI